MLLARRQEETLNKYRMYRVMGAAIDTTTDPSEPVVGLTLVKPSNLRGVPGPSSVTLWFLRDPEGNGPGFVEAAEAKK
jgi:hypothetical protein